MIGTHHSLPVVVFLTLYYTPLLLTVMNSVSQRAFIQVRMSSSRFPGKALAPLAGKPIIDRVVDRVSEVFPIENIVILTSEDQTDDPLVKYLEDTLEIYRGDLTNVFRRYQNALDEYPCDRFFRVCGDSPFLEPTLFERATELAEQDSFDLLSTKLGGELPLGKNVECINTDSFLALDETNRSDDELEHICNTFYDNPKKYELRPIPTPDVSVDHPGFCVDVVEDLKRLESAIDADKLNEKHDKYLFGE